MRNSLFSARWDVLFSVGHISVLKYDEAISGRHVSVLKYDEAISGRHISVPKYDETISRRHISVRKYDKTISGRHISVRKYDKTTSRTKARIEDTMASASSRGWRGGKDEKRLLDTNNVFEMLNFYSFYVQVIGNVEKKH